MNLSRHSVDSAEDNNDTASLINDSVNSQYQTIIGSVNTTSKTSSSGVSWYFAVFLIVNSALGAGVLNFGKAFNEAGGISISVIIQLVSLIS
jgi:sodium-coupled neutral amino acid transporter 7/8